MPPSLMSMICPSSATPAPAGIAQCKGISGGTGARGCARSWRLTVTLGKLMRIARVPSSVTSTGSEAGNSMCIPPNSATKVTCWHSSSAGIALPPESGSTTMYCLIGSTRLSFQRESAPPARRAASGSRRATSALSTRSTSPLEVDTRPGERVIARASAELTADLPGEPSPPAPALPHGREGRRGFAHGLLDVDRGQLAPALEDAPVHHLSSSRVLMVRSSLFCFVCSGCFFFITCYILFLNELLSLFLCNIIAK